MLAPKLKGLLKMSKVERLEKLRRKLKALPVAARQEIKAALIKSAEEITAMQKRLVPEDDGDLKNSIRYSMGGGKLDDQDLSVTIRAGSKKAFYAHWVEFGTAPYIAGGRFEGAEVPARKAQAFFYPAYRALKKRVKARINRATTKAAKKVAGA